MLARKGQIEGRLESETYPLGENNDHPRDGAARALVALSHTRIEQQIYAAMLPGGNNGHEAEAFTVRRIATIAGINSLSTVRRGLEGLIAKLSVERDDKPNRNGGREPGAGYRAHCPEAIIARRSQIGMTTSLKGLRSRSGDSYARAIDRVIENRNLSRREAQVTLCCVEGLTNAEIGSRLQVTEQTVKFHLRRIFLKFGVKRRAELISRLLL